MEDLPPFAAVFDERCDQLNLSTQQEIANYLNDHAADGSRTITRFSVCDWRKGRYTPAKKYHETIARAFCLTHEQVTLLCAGFRVTVASVPDEDELLGGTHAE